MQAPAHPFPKQTGRLPRPARTTRRPDRPRSPQAIPGARRPTPLPASAHSARNQLDHVPTSSIHGQTRRTSHGSSQESSSLPARPKAHSNHVVRRLLPRPSQTRPRLRLRRRQLRRRQARSPQLNRLRLHAQQRRHLVALRSHASASAQRRRGRARRSLHRHTRSGLPSKTVPRTRLRTAPAHHHLRGLPSRSRTQQREQVS